jgi:hypothetical protein
MLAAGVPMAIVWKMLRHSSIGITVDTYGHLSEETARTASDAIGALLDRAFDEATAAAGDHTGTTGAPADQLGITETTLESTKAQVKRGGPRGDRTHNPRIKRTIWLSAVLTCRDAPRGRAYEAQSVAVPDDI